MLGSAMLLAATVGSAAAKCEMPDPPEFCNEVVANVDFAGTGSTIRAGLDTPLRIWISRGEQPLEPTSVALVFARVADSAIVRAEATETPTAGLWRSEVNLPAGGSWTLVVEVDGIDGVLQRLKLDTLQVRQPLVTPDEPGTPAAPTPPNPTLPALPIALLVAGIAAVALVAAALRDRTKRRVAA